MKGEGKYLSMHAMKAYGGNEMLLNLFFILGARCRYDQLYSPAALSPGAALPGPIE